MLDKPSFMNSSKCSVFYYGIYNQGMIGIYYNEGWSNNFKKIVKVTDLNQLTALHLLPFSKTFCKFEQLVATVKCIVWGNC